MDLSLLLNPSTSSESEMDQAEDKDESIGSPSQEHKRRQRATPEQVAILNQVFDETMGYPTTSQRKQLAEQLGFTPRGIQIWFQNRRQDLKKRKKARRGRSRRGRATPTTQSRKNTQISESSLILEPPAASTDVQQFTPLFQGMSQPQQPDVLSDINQEISRMRSCLQDDL